jgi:cytochrome c oxidase subunit 3
MAQDRGRRHQTDAVIPTLANQAEQKERDLNSLYTMAIVITLGIVTSTFGAVVFAFVYRSYSQKNWTPIELPQILWASTAVLLASSAVLAVAQKRLKAGAEAAFHRMALQLLAWFRMLRAGVVLASNPHSSFIFIFSGMHGAHILLGLTGLFYLLRRTREPVSGPKYRMTTRVWANAVSIFWHYLDFVWIVLFAVLLFWKR